MTRIVECAACGGRFEGKRPNATYCSPRCRTRASRASKGEAVPPRRDAAIVVGLPPREAVDDENGFAAETRRELEAAGRLDTYLGRAAMYLAGIADARPGDTGSGHASLMKQYMVAMEAALDGAQVSQSAAERLRARHAKRAGAA